MLRSVSNVPHDGSHMAALLSCSWACGAAVCHRWAIGLHYIGRFRFVLSTLITSSQTIRRHCPSLLSVALLWFLRNPDCSHCCLHHQEQHWWQQMLRWWRPWTAKILHGSSTPWYRNTGGRGGDPMGCTAAGACQRWWCEACFYQLKHAQGAATGADTTAVSEAGSDWGCGGLGYFGQCPSAWNIQNWPIFKVSAGQTIQRDCDCASWSGHAQGRSVEGGPQRELPLTAQVQVATVVLLLREA